MSVGTINFGNNWLVGEKNLKYYYVGTCMSLILHQKIKVLKKNLTYWLIINFHKSNWIANSLFIQYAIKLAANKHKVITEKN